jgi:hypothetical protein
MRDTGRPWRRLIFGITLLLAVPLSAAPAESLKSENTSSEADETAPALPPVLWRHPGDIAARDLRYGPGSEERLPKGSLRFLKEELGGAEPKFDVEDEQGVRWRVKPGWEARPETAATRLLWAVGYFADEDYFLPEASVAGMPKLTRGQEHVSPDGLVRNARWERREGRNKIGSWNWSKNPFVGTKELNGLRVMMALMNNWDIKDANNAIYEESGVEHRYLVSDIGATFGRSGNTFRRTKDNLKHYRESKFIRETTATHVDFFLASEPHPLNAVIFPHWIGLRKREKVVKGIPREHARWIGQLLSQLSEAQIRDCFRAAGYSPEEVDGFTAELQERIQALNQL